MPLSVGKATLKAAILDLMGKPNTATSSKEDAAEAFAQAVIDCIATATFTSSTLVSATGGPVTGVQVGGLS